MFNEAVWSKFKCVHFSDLVRMAPTYRQRTGTYILSISATIIIIITIILLMRFFFYCVCFLNNIHNVFD